MEEKTDEALQNSANDTEPMQPVEQEPDQVISTDASESDPSAGVSINADLPEPMDTNSSVSSEPADQSTDLAISSAAVAEDLLETLTSEAPTTTPAEIFSPDAVINSQPQTDASLSSDTLDDALKNITEDKDSTMPAPVENHDVEANNDDTTAADPVESSTKHSVEPTFTLEEELQRLHEGDPAEENKEPKEAQEGGEQQVKPAKVMQRGRKSSEMTVKSDEAADVSVKKDKPAERRVSVPSVKPPVQTPIMKDSELEEMLSADDILSDPLLIKGSQDDLKVTDLLICGRCHETFHLIDEFQKHKIKKCSTKSYLFSTCENESKPQMWAFTLWKNKQLRVRKPGTTIPSTWDLYQTWMQLPNTDKSVWLSAGESLQFCSRISSAKLVEVKPPTKLEREFKLQVPKTTPQVKRFDSEKSDEQDPLALDGFDSNKENSTMGNFKKSVTEEKKPPMRLVKEVILPKNELDANKARGEYAVERIVAKRYNAKKKYWEYQIKWEHFPSEENTWEPLENLNHCKLMVDEFEKQLSKLKAEKAQQQAASLVKSRPKILNTSSLTATPGSSTSSLGGGGENTPNRPTRTSKQKALNQVKAWCGSISDEENATTGGAGVSIKRSRSPDSDDSFEKRIKFEDFSDDSDTDTKAKTPGNKSHFRKIAPKPPQQQSNGLGGGGKTTNLPPNILIPDANGVVRINQKQLPSLSTGVYIMSKTAGIIKLDSTTSKVATSGGQTIVKVAPKIGQTNIKIVKKDTGGGTSTKQIIQMSPAKPITKLTRRPSEPLDVKKTPELVKKTLEAAAKKATPTPLKKLPDSTKFKALKVREDRKPAQLIHSDSLTKQPEEEARHDESDDGLEPLPFPEEIKIPEPDSPGGEFTLDPFTGKIAGVEYPEPEPPAIVEENIKSESILDNIVKLAAADITEEDLKNEPMDESETSLTTQSNKRVLQQDEIEEPEEITTKPPTMVARKIVTAPPARTVVRMSVVPKRSPSSILNKALTTSQVAAGVGRKSILHTPKPPQHQRILNPSVARSPQVMNPIIKPISSYVRTKPVAPRPAQRQILADGASSRLIRPHHDTSPKNVYTFSRSSSSTSVQGMTRKIGNTTIRSSSSPMVKSHQQGRIVHQSSNVVQRMVVSPRKESSFIRGQPERVERKMVPAKPKTVISMPSLIGDDDLLLPQPKLVQTQKQKSPTPPPATSEANEPTLVPVTVIATEEAETKMNETTTSAMAKQEPEEMSLAAATEVSDASGTNLTADMSTFTLADNDNPIFITGDDGTVYQVAGQNEQGQTILLTQGSDGQQQCLLVTNEVAEAMETSATTEEEEAAEQQPAAAAGGGDVAMADISSELTEPLSVNTDPSDGGDQVVAQVVRAEPPSPGGTHKVVVMLPDGNLMVTQVSPEEYASLELE